MKDVEYKYKLAVRDVLRSFENRFSDDLLRLTTCIIFGRLKLVRV